MSKDTGRRPGADEPRHPIERELAAEEAQNAIDAAADEAATQCDVLDFGPYGLMDRRTWMRMLYGFALILAYLVVTTGLAWGVARTIIGAWAVPAGFQGCWSLYLLTLAGCGFFLTPLVLMAGTLVGWWAYRVGEFFWPLPRTSDDNDSTHGSRSA